MEEILKVAKGVNGTLELLEDKIRIRRTGVMGLIDHGLRGNKEILIKHISSIEFRKAGLIVGDIRFSFIGGTESRRRGAVHDPNAVTFSVFHQDEFDEMKSLIERKMAELVDRKQRMEGKGSDELDKLEYLERLAELKEKGIISEEEFENKKKEILGL